MRIVDLLLEFEMPSSLRDVPIIGIGDSNLTAGQISDALPGVDPQEVINQGKNIKDFLSQKITGDYSVSDALIDVVTLYPAFRIGKMAMAARAGGGAVSKEVAKGALRREVGQQVKKNVNVLPTMKGDSSSTTVEPTTPKKRKYNIGDKIMLTINGKKQSGFVKNILPQGYEVDVSHIPNSPSKTINIAEPLDESATAGATSSGNIASTGNSPHIAAGGPAVLKRWSGSPGKMGKSITPTKTKSQSAKDNPVTNPKVGNNLIS